MLALILLLIGILLIVDSDSYSDIVVERVGSIILI